MAQPIRVLPSLDLGSVFPHESFAIARIKFVFERQKRLLSHVAHVERDDAQRAETFGFETQKASRSADVENRFAFHLNASDVIGEAATKIPVPVLNTETQQIHLVI